MGRYEKGSIRQQLRKAFGFLLLLVVIAGALGWGTLSSVISGMRDNVQHVQETARLAGELSSVLMREVELGDQLINQSASERLGDTYITVSDSAHMLQQLLARREAVSPDEMRLTAGLDGQLSEMEIRYALGQLLHRLGRQPAAENAHGLAQASVAGVFRDIDRVSLLEQSRVSNTAAGLITRASRQTVVFVIVITAILVLALGTVSRTTYLISHPLERLVEQAVSFRKGDLTARTPGELPAEFAVLRDALDGVGESLAAVVGIAKRTADEVATAAAQLATVSGQISDSASQVASSMNEMSSGAATQVEALHQVDGALAGIGERAEGVRGGVHKVGQLATDIEASAREKHLEVQQAVTILSDISSMVQRAGAEAVALSTTAAEVNQFVEVVRAIAGQTNLLALNAAIEAARAGDAGRGFRVVADEVRTLANQARDAADQITKTTTVVTLRLGTATEAMTASASRVSEIGRVAVDVVNALRVVRDLAGQTRTVASSVTIAAEETTTAVRNAAANLTVIARTAESYAATAEQVGASTEEQSAACEEMTAASSDLLEGSHRLRQIVAGLKVA
jgi:methyl-accepting chemotaxis protein